MDDPDQSSDIDVAIADERWIESCPEVVASATSAAERTKLTVDASGLVTVLLSEDQQISTLNETFRQKIRANERLVLPGG